MLKEPQQPHDILPQLGVDLSVWEQQVRLHVETKIAFEKQFRNTPLISTLYVIDAELPEGEQEDVRAQFNKQVAELHRLYQIAHISPESRPRDHGFSDEEITSVRGKPFVHIIFSHQTDTGGTETNYDNQKLLAGRLEKAFQSVKPGVPLVLDLSNTELDPEITYRLSTFSLFKYSFYDNPPITIIDGYGKRAAELGFEMFDNFEFVMQPLIIRTSEKQTRHDEGYGSIWFDKFTQSIYSKDGLQTNHILGAESYRPICLFRFAKTLESVIGQIRQDDKPHGLQAPNNYGKSTALKVLTELLPKNTDKIIARISEDGALRNIVDGNLITSKELLTSAIGLLIIDEAGREQISDSHASRHIKPFEQNGGKVLRIYPGNVTPPEGYEVEVIE